MSKKTLSIVPAPTLNRPATTTQTGPVRSLALDEGCI